MSREYNIRWRESDTRELQRVIKNFNAKLYRIQKKDPTAEAYLPPKLSYTKVKNEIVSRKDYNNLIKSLQRFSQKGAEMPITSKRGATATKWDVQEFNIKQRVENIRRKNELKRIQEKEITSRGKPTGVKRAEMGTIKEVELKPSRKRFDNLSQREWAKAKESIDRNLNDFKNTQQMQKMKDNYIKGLTEAGFSENLISTVEKIPLKEFKDKVVTDTEASFDFIYDPQEVQIKESALTEMWGGVLDSLQKS